MKTPEIGKKTKKRSHRCGELSVEHEGQRVVLMGWVNRRRDHGSVVFYDLRDITGIVQLTVSSADHTPVKPESVICAEGVVAKRPEGMVRSDSALGAIEVLVDTLEILSPSQTPPFQTQDPNVLEATRLKYRYLDLRSERLQRNLVLRHRLMQCVRRFLTDQNFIEVETPVLYKSTPEGARDFLVPSRTQPGEFYALPQSPQTLKQLLMIAGYDRYFQIAKCFRDEDLRADRQPEFTQIDLEMSFVDQEDVMNLNESLLRTIWKEFKGVDIGPVPRMTFQEGMNRYGSDKPDLRFQSELLDVSDVLVKSEFRVATDVLAKGGVARAVVFPGGASEPRSRFDKLIELAKQNGAKGAFWIKWDAEDSLSSSASKFIRQELLKEMMLKAGPSHLPSLAGSSGAGVGAQVGDSLLVVCEAWETACTSVGAIRLQLAKSLGWIDPNLDKFLWVTDFPLLEYDANAKRWAARHHPFTSPADEAMSAIADGRVDEFSKLNAKAYDLVVNGNELGGGSVRIHNPRLQAKMFEALGFSPEDAVRKFGFFIEALEYGTPPHGGMAWGFDRLTMILAGAEAIRDVMAFPKTAKGSDLMSSSPSPVDEEQLLELRLRVLKAPAAEG